MKYAKQLPITVEYTYDPRKTKVIEKHVLGKHGKIEGVDDYSTVRRYIPKNIVSIFKAALPQKIIPCISGVTMTEITLLAPHVHTREMCVINFYQKTAGEVTAFYEGGIEVDDSWTLDNGNGYYLVKPSSITKTEEFIATDNSVWLLNTRQPHSVEEPNDARSGNEKYKPIREEKRILIQAFFDLPFDEVANYF